MEKEFEKVMNVFIIYYSMYGEGRDFYALLGDIMNDYKNNKNNEIVMEPIEPSDVNSDIMNEIYVLAILGEPVKVCSYIYPLLYLVSKMDFINLDWCIEKIENNE